MKEASLPAIVSMGRSLRCDDAGRLSGGIRWLRIRYRNRRMCRFLGPWAFRDALAGHRRETFHLGDPAAFDQESRRGEQPLVLAVCAYGKGIEGMGLQSGQNSGLAVFANEVLIASDRN